MSAGIKSNSSGNLELYSGSTKILTADATTGVANFGVAPTAPTAAASVNSTQVATTAMVHSAITNDLNVTGSAPMYACRAWLNYSGSSSTINASGNVSSVTKVQAGIYIMNFINAMPDTNYAVSGSGALANSKIQIYITGGGSALKTTSAQIETATSGAGTADSEADTMCVAIHR